MPRTKNTRRGNQEGAIWQRKLGDRKVGWAGQIAIGVDEETGKIIRKTVYGKLRQDVVKKLDEIKKDLNTVNRPASSDITVAEWLTTWHDGRKNNISQSTWDWYKNIIYTHINPMCGDIKLQKLSTREIQNLLTKKLETLSSSTVYRIYGTLNKGLNQAIKENIINYNPAQNVEKPKIKQKQQQTLTIEQVKIFINTARRRRYFIGFFLAITLGLRRGEVLGLKWADIDFDNKILTIKRQYTKECVFKEPKTQKSFGTIYLYDYVIETLLEHKEKQNKEKVDNPGYIDNDLVLATKAGTPINPRNFDRGFHETLEEAKLDYIRVHDLRHTFATLALEKGVELKVIQAILRHSRMATTADIYSHVTDKLRIKTANELQELFE